jgi:hypothetical protein
MLNRELLPLISVSSPQGGQWAGIGGSVTPEYAYNPIAALSSSVEEILHRYTNGLIVLRGGF